MITSRHLLGPIIVALTVCWLHAGHTAARRAVAGKHGVVAADHPLASLAGLEILKAGGNAVDAACATAFALGVVNPAGSGIGGGGFMLVYAPGKQPEVVDFRETAPAAASRDMYLKKGVAKIAPRRGGLAIAVPGEVAGCSEAVKRWGKLPLSRVLAPAIKLAQRGFPAGEHLVDTLKSKPFAALKAYNGAIKEIFFVRAKNAKTPTRAPELGETLRRPRLARTLKAIARGGAKAFYGGWIAKDIVATVEAAGGLLTLEDLANYRPKLRAPLTTTYRGYQILTTPPPSSGGIAIIETLNLLSRYKLKEMGHNSSRYLHHLTEALKHAFADRARHLGDSDFVEVPIAKLTSRDYADLLAKRIGKTTQPWESYGSGKMQRAGHQDKGTSHLSVTDRSGMTVALTTTINLGFGSMIVAKRSGVILNDQMDDFASRPGTPNGFGLIQSEKNAVQPGKRPLSSMSPTIVLKDGKALLAVGGSGGPTIITGTLQVLLNVLDFRLELGDAVARSRIHHQWLPNQLWVESDLPRDVRQALGARGHKLLSVSKPFTAIQAVGRTTNALLGASDPRKGGWPAAD